MIILYSMDDCAWCDLVKTRLGFAGISYREEKNIDVIKQKGFSTVPQLELPSGEILDHNEAITWVNSQKK